jgi:hypothetical protein
MAGGRFPLRYAFKATAGAMLNSVPDLDAQQIGDHIDSLIDQSNEHIGTDEILADARRTASPTHHAFEWDENKAAERFRRKQAKSLLNQLVVAKNGKPTRTRAFVYVAHPEHDGKHVYLNVRSAMGRPEFRAQVIEQAVNALNRWLNFYGPQLGTRLRLTKDVDRLRAKIERELMATI